MKADAVDDTVIWILIADDWNAQIHVSRDGSSSLLRSLRNRFPERILRHTESEADDFAQFRDAAGLPAIRPRDTHLCFAHELLWLLGDGAFDGLIVMATAEMMEALNAIGAPAVRERVIARIVMAGPIGNPELVDAATHIRVGGGSLGRHNHFDFMAE
jgi:hypothetical protein